MERLCRIVRHYAVLLNLRDWLNIRFDDPAAEEHMANVSPVYGQRYATMRVGSGWETWAEETIQSTIVHGLFYLCDDGTCQVARSTAYPLSVEAGSVVRTDVDLALKHASDAVALSVTLHRRPPPPWTPRTM